MYQKLEQEPFVSPTQPGGQEHLIPDVQGTLKVWPESITKKTKKTLLLSLCN